LTEMGAVQTSETCDVLVVGAGIIGVCAAYYCAAAGARVILLEQDSICAGCSQGNAGLIVPSHSIPLSAPGVLRKTLSWLLRPDSPFYIKPRFDLDLLRWLGLFSASCNDRAVRAALPVIRDLARASGRLYREILSAPGPSCGWDQKGLLMLYSTVSGQREGQAHAALLQEFEIESKEPTLAEAREMVPAIKPAIVGATYYPEDAHLVPDDFVQTLAKRAEVLGVRILSSTRVKSFRSQGGSISAALTATGAFRASQIVIASGAWSSGLFKTLKISLPLQPAKGYSVTLPAISERVLEVPLLLHEAKVAVTPMKGRIRFAGTLELAGFDTTINQRRVRSLLRGSRDYLAGIEFPDDVTPWAGLRPCSPDGLPILGRFEEYKNVVVATGHGMLGVTLGPITGKLVSEMACGQALSLDIARLAPSRFS
jgi:D-amino-acid dehydrogenase